MRYVPSDVRVMQHDSDRFVAPSLLSAVRLSLISVRDPEERDERMSQEQVTFLEDHCLGNVVSERGTRWDLVKPLPGDPQLDRVDVYCDVEVEFYAGSRLPLRFGRILGGHFYVLDCPNLVSLDGAPFGAPGYVVADCPRVPSHHFQILRDREWRHAWWNSGLGMDQRWSRNRGRVAGRKLGF